MIPVPTQSLKKLISVMPAVTPLSADELVSLLAVILLIALQGNDHHVKVSAERRTFAAPAASTPKSYSKKRGRSFLLSSPQLCCQLHS